jgi:hypothetical protein
VPVGGFFFTCEHGARSMAANEPAAGLRVRGCPPPVWEGRTPVLQSGGVTHACARGGSGNVGRRQAVSCRSTCKVLGESSAQL